MTDDGIEVVDLPDEDAAFVSPPDVPAEYIPPRVLKDALRAKVEEVVDKYTPLNDEEKKRLRELDFTNLSPGDVDFKNRIVGIFSNPDLLMQYSDLSIEETKLLCRGIAVAQYTGDRVRMNFCMNYIQMKVSKDRKGRGEAVQMVVADVQRENPSFVDRAKGFLGFGKKEGAPA
jgi:hypothetical protein